MTILTLFTDPHIGTKRAAHTTRESSKLLQTALYEAALEAAKSSDNSVCLGDLFDRSLNPEDVLVQGFNVAEHCRWVLSGNHDCLNREGVVTSLEALKEMHCHIISAPVMSVPFFATDEACYMVPHHASQELFEQALFQAAEHAAKQREGKASVLMLHCNYDCAFDIEDDTLNLSHAMAEELLVAFDYIFIGHEHKPSTHFDGRLVILGNTHPTSFADVSDKFSYTLQIDDGFIQLDQTCIWSAADHYREIKLGAELPNLTGVQFVDVVGVAEADDALVVSEFVQSIWKSSDQLLAVRNNVQISDHLQGVSVDDSRPALVDLKAKIAEDLQGSDMLSLYQQLLQEIEA